MVVNCSSWPPVRVSRFRPFLSYMENPWAPGHISKCEGGTGGSIAPFLRGAMLHSMNFRTSKHNFYQQLFLMGGGHIPMTPSINVWSPQLGSRGTSLEKVSYRNIVMYNCTPCQTGVFWTPDGESYILHAKFFQKNLVRSEKSVLYEGSMEGG